jgi:hypothetical protein
MLLLQLLVQTFSGRSAAALTVWALTSIGGARTAAPTGQAHYHHHKEEHQAVVLASTRLLALDHRNGGSSLSLCTLPILFFLQLSWRKQRNRCRDKGDDAELRRRGYSFGRVQPLRYFHAIYDLLLKKRKWFYIAFPGVNRIVQLCWYYAYFYNLHWKSSIDLIIDL